MLLRVEEQHRQRAVDLRDHVQQHRALCAEGRDDRKIPDQTILDDGAQHVCGVCPAEHVVQPDCIAFAETRFGIDPVAHAVASRRVAHRLHDCTGWRLAQIAATPSLVV